MAEYHHKKHTAEWWMHQYHTVFGGIIYGKYDRHYPSVSSFEEELISRLYCEQMISVLSPWQKKVILLRLDGYDNTTIAGMLKCGYSSVCQALRHARKRLRGTSIDPDFRVVDN